jgi:hypothetical protein
VGALEGRARGHVRAAIPRCVGIDMLEFYLEHTGRTVGPSRQSAETWLPTGARGGKSRIAALIKTNLRCVRDYLPFPARGEFGTIPIIAAETAGRRIPCSVT